MTTFIKGATILAMGGQHGAEPFTGDILVEGDRITAIGTALRPPADAAVIARAALAARLRPPAARRCDGDRRRRKAGHAGPDERASPFQRGAVQGPLRQ